MILNKKGLAVLPLVALLFATSCAKSISYEDACNFVRENYTSKEEKAPKSGIAEFSGWGANEASKKEVKAVAEELGITLDANLHYKEEITPDPEEDKVAPLSEDKLPKPTDMFEVTYSVKGKELTISTHSKIDITGNYEEMNGTYAYNSEGYQTKEYMKIAVKAGELNYWYSIDSTAKY